VPYSLLKFWASETPLPVGIPINLPSGGFGYFMNYALEDRPGLFKRWITLSTG